MSVTQTLPASTTAPDPFILTDAQINHFLDHGYIKLSNCFSQSAADELTANLWTRLGMSATDKSTWTAQRTNMPHHRSFPVSSFAPKAWSAICQLVGGEERVHPETRDWKDSLIVNLGSPETEGKTIPPWEEFGWHVDGDFFVHYLSSPEQGLLVIPLFTPIKPGGGGTWICPRAVGEVARYLASQPQGVSPRFTPRRENPEFKESYTGLGWFNGLAQRIAREAGEGKAESEFVEATGEVGDVYLLHPLMLHTASANVRRELRVITNPPVSLSEEMKFVADGGYVMSPVERKTAREVGEDISRWRRAGERQELVPERVRKWIKMKEDEERRLNGS